MTSINEDPFDCMHSETYQDEDIDGTMYTACRDCHKMLDGDMYDDTDKGYDAWADQQVDYFYDHLKERQMLYKKLLLCDYSTNNVKERDELEKLLVKNLTGEDGLWMNINSIHGWYQERDKEEKNKL